MTYRDAAAFMVGVVVTILGYATYTDFCLTTPGRVWDTDHAACVAKTAYVPAGYIPR